MKQTQIKLYLPGVFQRTIVPGGVLATLLEVMEVLHQPSEDVLQELDAFFDPRRTADRFLPLLAAWVDLDKLLAVSSADQTDALTFPTGLARLRELIAAAAFLSQWRGTSKGLLHFLETATGAHGFEINEQVTDSEGQPVPFHLRIVAPQETAAYQVLLESIIELEKPAYVTYELKFG